MIYQATYKPASIVARKIEEHFQNHVRSVCEGAESLPASIPPAAVIENIVDAAFWASLRTEEGHPPKISIAFLTPEQAVDPLLFQNKIPLSAQALIKLAPGLERAGIHMGVSEENGVLYIWGTTIRVPNLCFVLDLSEPGLLVIKHRRMCGFGKFTNVAVLKGDQIKMIDSTEGILSDAPQMLKVLLDLSSPGRWNDAVNIQIQLAVSMRAHKKGGCLLVVPGDGNQWKESIIQPINYELAPAFTGLHSILNAEYINTVNTPWQTPLNQEVAHIAGLTAIDGATIISEEHHLLAFGAKIGRSLHSSPVENVLFMEPVNGGTPKMMHPGSIGGTRHLSAAQFVHDQRNVIALVASQDGHFTVFSWSEEAKMVAAYRIESLLL